MKRNPCLISITVVPVINRTAENWMFVRRFAKANAPRRKEISSDAKPIKPNLKSPCTLTY